MVLPRLLRNRIVARMVLEAASRRRRPIGSQRKVVNEFGTAFAVSEFDRLLNGPAQRFKDSVRMDQAAFRQLVSWLKEHTGLEDNRFLSVASRLILVLYIFAQNL